MTVTVRKSYHVRSCVRRAVLFAQQKQSMTANRNSYESPPRRWFVERHDACERHDCHAASRNCRNRRKRPALFKKQKELVRASADANAGKRRVSKTSSAEFLTPSCSGAIESPSESRSTMRCWLRQCNRRDPHQCARPQDV